MNLTQTLAAQHVAYERDLEPDNYGMDYCPFDNVGLADLFDDDTEPPCNYCAAAGPCGCLDRGGRFTCRY